MQNYWSAQWKFHENPGEISRKFRKNNFGKGILFFVKALFSLSFGALSGLASVLKINVFHLHSIFWNNIHTFETTYTLHNAPALSFIGVNLRGTLHNFNILHHPGKISGELLQNNESGLFLLDACIRSAVFSCNSSSIGPSSILHSNNHRSFFLFFL